NGTHTQDLAWSTSNPAVATVNAQGVVTGVAPGQVTISATSTQDTTRSSSLDLQVQSAPAATPAPVAVQGVTIAPAAPRVHVGAELLLAATVQLSDGRLEQDVTWATADGTKAVVSASGWVRGLGIGAVTVTATSRRDPGKSATVTVQVFSTVATLAGGFFQG